MAFNSGINTGTLASASPLDQESRPISAIDYERFCRFLEKRSGIVLGANKEYLVKNRLRSLLEETREKSFSELLDVLESGTQRALEARVIDAMTTNETLWFRDVHPFEILSDRILPELAENSRERFRPIRIWSAASSTGQEAYSISITIHEFQKRHPGTLPQGVEIVATDISQSAIQQAREAVYGEYEIIRGLSDEYQRQYFIDEGHQRRVIPEIRNRVRFQEMNLLQSYSLLGQFEVIFCRNVLIYFSNDVKADILSRMAKALKPGGYLFLGGSEPIANYSDEFEMIRGKQGVVYKLKQLV